MEKISSDAYIFLQDRAWSHSSKISIAQINKHCREYVNPEFCPLNSFDMNVLDIGIWVELKARSWEKGPDRDTRF